MPYRKRKRKKSTNKIRLIATGFGLFIILILLGVILILLPQQNITDSQSRSGQDGGDQSVDGSDTKAAQATAQPINVPEEKQKNDTAVVPERPEISKGEISILIDDVGYNLEELKPFLLLPGKVSFAVLPGLKYSKEASRLIKAAGKELLLHLPMESDNGNDPGPGALYAGDDPGTIASIIRSDLETVPGAIGINNHMGSKATRDIATMSSVFSAIQGKGLFFLDSKTTSESKAGEIGPLFGIEVIERDIFLDNDTSPEAILSQVEKGLLIAEESGSCVFIGHVQNKAVYEVLNEVLPQIGKKSYTLISLAKMVGKSET